jgi:hypothetical protein
MIPERAKEHTEITEKTLGRLYMLIGSNLALEDAMSSVPP